MRGKRLGLDLGGTRIKAGILEDGKIIEEFSLATPVRDGYGAVLDAVSRAADTLLEKVPDAESIGVGVPGLIDREKGQVCYSNNFGWREVPFAADMRERLGREVRIANDAHCAALGEALYGAGRTYRRVAMFTLGTGVGGGFVQDGRIEGGRYGAMAYIFGHEVVDARGRLCNCGRQGCLESYACAGALEKRGAGIYEDGQGAREIFEAARAQEPWAVRIVDEFLEYLCVGAVNIANILRPEAVVIGGGISASADMILPRLQSAFEKGVYGYLYAPVKAVCAELKNQAGMAGAASL